LRILNHEVQYGAGSLEIARAAQRAASILKRGNLAVVSALLVYAHLTTRHIAL
jgi:hypothetical protein